MEGNTLEGEAVIKNLQEQLQLFEQVCICLYVMPKPMYIRSVFVITCLFVLAYFIKKCSEMIVSLDLRDPHQNPDLQIKSLFYDPGKCK